MPENCGIAVSYTHLDVYKRQFQHFQNVGDLPGDVVHGTKFQLVVNLPTQRKVIRHSTIGREKSSDID